MNPKPFDTTDSTMDMDFEQSDRSIKSEETTMRMSNTYVDPTLSMSDQSSTTWTDSQPSKSSGKLPSSYLDIDDILAQSERIPCEFRTDLYGLGFLDVSSDSFNLPQGTKLDLPLWMARSLNALNVVKVQTPKAYCEAYREILEADPTVVDLHRLGPNYYKVGEYLVRLDFPESNAIATSLVRTFYGRLNMILDHSLNLKSDELPEGKEFKKRLDNVELQLYETGKRIANELQMWEEKQLDKISANAMVIDIRKRRQAAISACASNIHVGANKTLI